MITSESRVYSSGGLGEVVDPHQLDQQTHQLQTQVEWLNLTSCTSKLASCKLR